MTETIDDAIGFELHNINTALVSLAAIMQKTAPNTKAHEFYSTIEHALFALQYAMNENRMMHRAYSQMVARVDILERLLLLHLPEKEMITHNIIDKLKNS